MGYSVIKVEGATSVKRVFICFLLADLLSNTMLLFLLHLMLQTFS